MPTEASTSTAPTSPTRPSFIDWIGRNPSVTMLGGLIVLAVIFFSAMAPSRFLSLDTPRAMAFQMPELGILSLAMMVPLMSRGLNLAIIATANLSALVMAAILTRLIQLSTPQPTVATVILLALLFGLLSGVIVAFFGVHPILVTLGMMTLVKGAAVLATSGTVIGGFPPAILFLGNGAVFVIPVALVLIVAGGSVFAVILSHTPFGI